MDNTSWTMGNTPWIMDNKSLRIGNTAIHMPSPKASLCNWHKPAKHSRSRHKKACTKHMSLAHDTSGTHSIMPSCPHKLWQQIISLLLVHETAQLCSSFTSGLGQSPKGTKQVSGSIEAADAPYMQEPHTQRRPAASCVAQHWQ